MADAINHDIGAVDPEHGAPVSLANSRKVVASGVQSRRPGIVVRTPASCDR
jgi:hypothetical protein